jgi:hypothetical protein
MNSMVIGMQELIDEIDDIEWYLQWNNCFIKLNRGFIRPC